MTIKVGNEKREVYVMCHRLREESLFFFPSFTSNYITVYLLSLRARLFFPNPMPSSDEASLVSRAGRRDE